MNLTQRGQADTPAIAALQHHAVLTGLGVDGADLALAKSVIQGIVDSADADAQTRRGVTVDVQKHLQATVLQVAGHVGQFRLLAQRLDQTRRPGFQQLAVGRLQGELELGTADAILDGQVLHRLHEQLDTGNLRQLRTQTLDYLTGGDVAFGVGFQVDQQTAAVERRIVAIHANRRGQAGHRRITQDDIRQALLTLAHGGKGDRLRRLGNTLDHAGVLHREEALGHRHIQQHGQAQGRHGHQQGQRLMPEHPLQPDAIAFDHGVDGATGGAIEAPFLLGFLGLEQARAHHRREGQRHHQGNQDGHGQGNGELAEQPADHIGHEQQRDQYGNQRQGQRDQGEADLPGALERGVERRLALLQMAGDVLQHDDGVVDHETGGDGQRHQRQVVDGETGQVHHTEGADQRQRHDDRRDDGRRQLAQEQEGHHHHQGNGQQQFVLHIAHRSADGLRAVGEHLDLDAGRQALGQVRQQGLDAVDHIDDVGTRLTLHVDQYRLVAVGPGGQAFVLGAVDDLGDILQAQRGAVLVAEDQLAVFLDRFQLVVGVELGNPRGPVEVALGLVDVAGRDQAAHVGQAQAIGRQRLRVDADTHRRALPAGQGHQADTAGLRELLRQAGIDQVVDLRQRHRL